MNIIIWLIVGGLIGWVASMLMGTDGRQGLLLNVVVGIVGAFIAGLTLPRVGLGMGGGLIAAIIHATIGAVILLVLLRLVKSA